MPIFLVILPGFLWSLSKRFYCHCAMGGTIGKIRRPRQPHQCQWNKVAEGRIWPSGSNNGVKPQPDLKPPPTWYRYCASFSHGVNCGNSTAGVALCQLRKLPGDISGFAWRCNSAQHHMLGGCSLTRGNFAHLRGSCAQQAKLYKMMHHLTITNSVP